MLQQNGYFVLRFLAEDAGKRFRSYPRYPPGDFSPSTGANRVMAREDSGCVCGPKATRAWPRLKPTYAKIKVFLLELEQNRHWEKSIRSDASRCGLALSRNGEAN